VNIKKSLKGLVALAIAGTFSANAIAAPSNAEIFDMMQEMKKELKNLKAENNELKGTVEEVAVSTDEAIKAQIKLANKSSWGGYGELHYNNLEGQGPGVSDTKKIDFHRFVLYFGHEFRDDLRFFSEFELEHALAGDGDDKPGEVELEQAYIQYDYNDTTQVTGGLFLVPIGIMNETHEPDTFYGVERNTVEKNIIPTTWWEAGVMVKKELKPGLTLDVALTSGLKGTSSAFKARSRQKVANAKANSGAMTTRLKYTAIPGLEVAASLFMQTDFCQGQVVGCGAATAFETHAIYKKDKFQLRALYAGWNIDGDAVKAAGADKQNGYYLEPSYRFNDKWGAFARYETYDNKDGSTSTADTEVKARSIGFNYWIDPTVVAKFDYVDQSKANEGDKDGINIGLGYSF